MTGKHTKGPSLVERLKELSEWFRLHGFPRKVQLPLEAAATITDLLEALDVAVRTIRALHGIGCTPGTEPGLWNIYNTSSPEMRKINAALLRARGEDK